MWGDSRPGGLPRRVRMGRELLRYFLPPQNSREMARSAKEGQRRERWRCLKNSPRGWRNVLDPSDPSGTSVQMDGRP